MWIKDTPWTDQQLKRRYEKTEDIIAYEESKQYNELLKQALEYEQAERRLAQYKLSEGRPEIPEITDPDTGEITQQYQEAIAPLPATITVTDENGEAIEVPNPLIQEDEEARAKAQSVIASVTLEALNLVNYRKGLEELTWEADLTEAITQWARHKASNIILALVPEWKQRNIIARAVELESIENPTEAEIAEKAQIQQFWDSIKEIRNFSNTITVENYKTAIWPGEN